MTYDIGEIHIVAALQTSPTTFQRAYMALAINITNGHGFGNKMFC